MGDPLRVVMVVVFGWVVLGLALSAAAAPLARARSPRTSWILWALVVLPVFVAGSWFILRDPLPLPLGPAYHMLLLALVVLLPTVGAVWTAAVRARREPRGPLLVDVLLSSFTFFAILVVGFVAGIIPDLMTIIGA